MNKSGLVIQINKNQISLMTSSGEFVKVKARGNVPSLGELYSGEMYKNTPYPRLSLIAAVLVFFILVGGGSYTYYVPAATVTIEINPSLKLELNRWNRIIKVSSLNDDGEKILHALKLKNKTVDEALVLILDEAKDTNFITEAYKKNGGNISVHITENEAHNIDISKFQQTVKDENLNTTITRDSENSNSNKGNDKNSEIKTLPNSDNNNNTNTNTNNNNNSNSNSNNNSNTDTNNNKDTNNNNKDTNNNNKDTSNNNNNKDIGPRNPWNNKNNGNILQKYVDNKKYKNVPANKDSKNP